MPKPVRRPLLVLALVLLALPASASARVPGSEDDPRAAPPLGAPSGDASAPSQRSVYRSGQSGRFLLDGEWLHRMDPGNEGLRAGFARSSSLEGWSAVSVPHAWNGTDISDPSARGTIGWYRKDFRRPAAARGDSWVLRLESVNYRARVYLNGREIGRHEGGFIPFEVRASSIRPGVNRLVVRVDNRRRTTDIPPVTDQSNGRPGGGWWNYGGMLREVYLRRVRGVDMRALLARPILPCRTCDARVLVRATVANHSSRRQRVGVVASVGGRSVRLRSVVVRGRRSRTVSGFVRVPDPRLWEPGSPSLYRVVASARVRGRVRSTYRTDIGIRSIRVRRGIMRLNGRPVRLRGASMHEDHPDRGAALLPGDIEANIDLLRSLGATITRAHYPMHPLTLELADRHGIMVWAQIPFNRGRFGETANTTESAVDSAIRSNQVRAKALRYVKAAIARDQNHPSVFAWSVANEPDERPGAAERDYFAKAKRIVDRMDPSRLAAVDLAGYSTIPQSDDYAQFDAIGLNSYFGWYAGPSGSLDAREDLRPFLRLMRNYYRRSALFITEFGAEANRSGPIDEKGTFAFQEDLLGFHLDEYDRAPWVNGAVVWILRDFRTQPGWDGGNPKPSPPVNTKGLVDMDGGRKPAFDALARRFQTTAPLR